MSQLLFRMCLPILICLAMISPSTAQSDSSPVQSQITVSVESLNVRSGPGLEHPVIGTIQKGEKYQVLLRNNNWVQIPLRSGTKGWVAGWMVDIAADDDHVNGSSYVSPTIDSLNVRSGPSTTFQVIDRINKDEKFKKLDTEGDWIQILLQDGRNGWTASWLTTTPTVNVEKAKSTEQGTGVVSVPTLNIRQGPSTNTPILGQAVSGTTITIMERKNNWLHIKDGTITGWVSSEFVSSPNAKTGSPSSISPEQHGTIKIIEPGTNIRSGAGTSHSVVTVANTGDTFQVLQKSGDWFKVQLTNGKIGYVAGWIVSAQGMPNVQSNGTQNLLKGKTFVVDAGHGGEDSGAIGPHLGTLEKMVNLKIAKLLAGKLQAAGANVVMTRSDDSKISLQGRVDMAVDQQADAFISIHHNISENYLVHGVSTYFYSNGNDQGLATKIQKELVRQTGLTDLNAKFGDFFVLRENPQLAVLCEVGFLSNYQEEILINTNDFQEQAAEGIFQGLLKYYNSLKLG